MELLRKKRKGCKWAAVSSLGSHLSYDDSVARDRKKIREKELKSCLPKDNSCKLGVILTAPPFRGSSSFSDSPGRGLKRKIGCIEAATRIGRKKKIEQEYILEREIGQGKFGSVRLCRSLTTGKEFACKTLPKNGEETVHREVEIMQHLSGHPGVVTLNAVYEDSESFHLVMELCTGGRLLDVMAREGRYTEQRAANLLKELILVIKYCHDMGVVHRDIKPENILLTASGKMKLGDFGLAVRVANGQNLSGVAGSPAYVAPEVLSGTYSEKVDIWGAGVLLHVLLIGVLPFQGESLDAVFDAIKTVELDFHSGPWVSISKLARDLVGRMLTRDVAERLTADEVLGHHWILFYTDHERPARGLAPGSGSRSNDTAHKVQLKRRAPISSSSSSNLFEGVTVSSSESLDDLDIEDHGFVDVLTVALSRVRISEPKRSRLCILPGPIQQESSSNLKANLCTAF